MTEIIRVGIAVSRVGGSRTELEVFSNKFSGTENTFGNRDPLISILKTLATAIILLMGENPNFPVERVIGKRRRDL
jgi:hypothetical protein